MIYGTDKNESILYNDFQNKINILITTLNNLII